MQPHGRGTRTSVEAESERALACVIDVILGIGDVENAGLGGAVFELQEDGAGRGSVFDFLPADFDRMLGLNDFFFRSWRLLFLFGFFCRFIRCWRWLLLSKAQIRCKKK